MCKYEDILGPNEQIDLVDDDDFDCDLLNIPHDIRNDPPTMPVFRTGRDERVYKLCLLGALDKDIANFLKISVTTLTRWKKSKRSLREAIAAGKREADMLVAQSLFGRALGYSHKEDKIFNAYGSALVVETIKHYPPDVTACIFWLKNRDRENWRDVSRHEMTGKDGKPIENVNMNVDLSKMSKIEKASRLLGILSQAKHEGETIEGVATAIDETSEG